MEQGVRVGQCAIEFRAYNAGTATITATSSGLTSGTTTIVINHAADSSIVYLPPTGVLSLQMPTAAPKLVRQMMFVGNSIPVPLELRGRTFSVAIFSLQGRLINEFQCKGIMPAIKVGNAAEAALLARFSTR